MKKLFLIPLLACFFCIGANAVDVTTEAELREALAYSPAGTQINLMNSIEGAYVFVVPNTADVILNLNSYTLSTTYYDEYEGWETNAVIYNAGKLRIISEGTGTIQLPLNGGDAAIICNDGNLTIDGGIYIGKRVYMPWISMYFRMPTIWGANGSITINGGTFALGNGDGDIPFGLIAPGSGSLVISGGRFSNDVSSYICEDCKSQSVAFSNTFASWLTNVYFVTSKDAATISDLVSVTGDHNEEAVVVASGAQMTVEAGATLTIAGDLAFTDNSSKLVVEKGGTVIVGDEITAANHNNIELTMDDKNKDYSNLLVAAGELQESHPKATVAFNTKARRKADTHKLVWQRFAVPSHTTFDIDDLINVFGFETCVEGWDYEHDCWKIINSGESLEPFQMYALAINNEIDPATQSAQYNFQCELVGNGNPELTIREGWNYFANAYTAPMNLKAWLGDLLNDPNYEGVIDGTIYVQKLQESNAWGSVTAARAKQGKFGALSPELQPMQAFIYHATENTTIPLKYKEYVYDPIVNPGVAAAPARKEAQEEEYTEATIIVTPAGGEADYLYVYEGADFSDNFDNGFDATKFMNEDVLNAYFETVIGDLSDYATNDLNNAALTIKTAEESEITISFEDVTLEGYFLVDAETETKTEIKSGNSYVFVGAANTTYSQRFSIVKDEEPDPSAVENVEASQKKNGIYTLTGQYMGNSLNALPKGVYIINGQKVVR